MTKNENSGYLNYHTEINGRRRQMGQRLALQHFLAVAYAMCVAGRHYLARLNDQPTNERRIP